MKCSLLTLSTFIDGELAPPRRAEVDAHLVGCTRCRAGAATLAEEKTRIGQLARVSVDSASTQLMLEQVGIVVASTTDIPPMAPAQPSPPDEHRPWQGGTRSPSLPWTPRRPEPGPPVTASEGIVVAPAVAADTQPDLPLDGMRSVPPSWNRVAQAPVPSPQVDDAVTGPERAPQQDVEWIEADHEWPTGAGAPDSWEADLPPPADAEPPPATTWSAPAPPSIGAAAPSTPATEPVPPLHAGPPTRLATASGPAALWTRLHDAVSVRLALARGGDAIEDSVQIVSGAPAPRGTELPVEEPQRLASSGIVAAPSPPAAPAQLAPSSEVELSGFVSTPNAAEPPADAPHDEAIVDQPADRRHRGAGEVVDDDRRGGQPADTAGWNAFAASSYPELEVPVEHPVENKPPRPLGRHSRAVAREQAPLSTRVGQAVSAATAAIRGGSSGATARVRQGLGRVGSTGPDNRLLAGIAGIGLIFVVALIIGHGSPRATPTATRPPAVTAQPQAHQSTPAQSSAAAPTGVAPTPVRIQSYGAGDTGFQVIRLRYGAQAGYMRVVFDLGAASGGAAGTPRVTVSFSSPTTMLVTFNGTVPAGSTGTPTPGKVISSVSLVSNSATKTVYRFGLTRPATATAFYLASPTRFVLDIH